MGCLASKHAKTSLKVIKNSSEQQKNYKEDKAQEYSTSHTLSQSPTFKSNIQKITSSISQTSQEKPSKILLSDFSTLKLPTVTKITGTQSNFQEKKNYNMFLQLLYGFPSQNIVWLKEEDSYLNKFVLKGNIDIFIKILFQCEECKKKSLRTSCKTLMKLQNICEQCKCQQGVISLKEVSPKKVSLWLEEQKLYPFEMKDIKIKRVKTLRIVGCTSCWKFKNLKKRKTCSCFVCLSCAQLACEICKN